MTCSGPSVASALRSRVTRAGERFAGVVVATSFSDDTPEDDLLGLTAAHEIGHFLGLFHTSEAAGFEDPLEDTEGTTEDNLMHHLSRSDRDQLTEHQGMVPRERILRGSQA